MDYYLSVATFAALNVVLALGLNLISGFCGQVSLGHAAFYGLGAYAAARCSVAGVPFVASIADGICATVMMPVGPGVFPTICRIHSATGLVMITDPVARDLNS